MNIFRSTENGVGESVLHEIARTFGMTLTSESLLRTFSLLAFGGGCMLAVFGATTTIALAGIAALICFLAAAVLFVGGAIVAAISDLQRSHPAAAAPPPHKDPHLGTL